MDPFLTFLHVTRQLVIHHPDPMDVTRAVAEALSQFLQDTGWDMDGDESPEHYSGRLLYEDPALGFIAVLMSWGPGAITPIHDHGTWGVMGVTRGHLSFTNFRKVGGEQVAPIQHFEADVGTVTRVVSPEMDVHQIANPDNHVARSLHIYGRNIGF